MQKVALHWIAKTHQLFSPDAPDDQTLITSLLMPFEGSWVFVCTLNATAFTQVT